ncbi:CLIP domain-containing serine protease 2 [Drosophila erecta]|uniref:GG19643 n=1 Tax=Drosophila erecta TaxID=7220 RepID=B3P149_DROER|nr:CLIP domain-containing serine protease 2 [Drosophila erecta]
MYLGLIGYFLLMLQILLPQTNGKGCQFATKCVQLHNCPKMRANMITNSSIRVCGMNKICCPNPKTYMLPDTCGISRRKPTKGRVPTPNEFPWIAMLLYSLKNNMSQKEFPRCGGSLINKWYVLTAAHCVDYPFLPPSLVLKRVRLGEHDRSTNPDWIIVNGRGRNVHPYLEIDVDQIIAHEQFNRGKKMINDIALLRLKVPVRYTTAIQPICIPIPQRISLHKREFRASGWPEIGQGFQSEVLLRSFIAERHPDVCKSNEDFDFRSQICAGGLDGNHTRQGDSGGPLMETVLHGTVLVTYATGIISYGLTPPCQENRCKPEFHTNTAYFREWIISKL